MGQARSPIARFTPQNLCPQLPRFLVWGDFCQGGAPRVLSIFLSLSFFVRPGRARFFIPTRRLMAPAARRSGELWRVSATEGLVLEGSEHDGTLGSGRG